MKKAITVALAIAVALSLSGCGKDDDEMTDQERFEYCIEQGGSYYSDYGEYQCVMPGSVISR